MITLQEYLNNTYPTAEEKKALKEINILEIFQNNNGWLEGGSLDLSEYEGLEKINISRFPNIRTNYLKTPLIELNLSGCANLVELNCSYNKLTSVNFLEGLPHPEKLKRLLIFTNNIKSTDVSFFKPFINLEILKIGNITVREKEEHNFKKGEINRFYGSLESFKNLSKLKEINFANTDINKGIEFLPDSLIKNYSEIKKLALDASDESCWCSVISYNHFGYPDENNNWVDSGAKCKVIYEQLKPLGHNIETWQLKNIDIMLISRPELFTIDKKFETVADDGNQCIKDIKEALGKAIKLYLESKKNLEQKITDLEDELKIEREEVVSFQKKSEEWSKKQKQELLEENKRLKEEVERLKKLTSQELIAENAQLKSQLEQLTSQPVAAQIEVKK